MSGKSSIYEFTAWAKICSSRMAKKYVKGVNVGKDMSELMDRILLLGSYIQSLENYRFYSCKDFVYHGRKHLMSGHVILSNKNSIFLESKDKKIRLDSDSLNCVTMKELCLLAEQIRSICINC